MNSNISNIEGLNITPSNYTFIGFTEQFMKDAEKKYESFDLKDEQCNWLEAAENDWKIPSTLSQFYTLVDESFKVSFLISYAIAHRG